MCKNCNNDNGFILDLEAALAEIKEQIRLSSMTDEEFLQMHNDRLNAIRDSATQAIAVTDNVNLHIIRPIPHVDQMNLTNWIRRMVEVAPPSGTVDIYVPYQSERSEDGATTRVDKNGVMTKDSILFGGGNRVMTLAEGLFFDRSIKTASDANKTDPNWSMPVGHHVSNLYYTFVHEWGHVVDGRSVDDNDMRLREMSTLNRLMYTGKVDTFMQSLSTYAQSREPEAYAEAFAEWTISKGKTHNFAAKWYAREYGWHLYDSAYMNH